MFYVVVLGELGQEQVHVDVEGQVDVVVVVGMEWPMMLSTCPMMMWIKGISCHHSDRTRPPGMHIGLPLLRNTMTRALNFPFAFYF